MSKNTLGINIDGPTRRRWQFIEQSLNAAWISTKDELPLMLTGYSMRKRGSGAHQIDFDIPIAGMASQGIGELIRFD